MRNGHLRLVISRHARNVHLEAENGPLREFIEQLQSLVGRAATIVLILWAACNCWRLVDWRDRWSPV